MQDAAFHRRVFRASEDLASLVDKVSVRHGEKFESTYAHPGEVLEEEVRAVTGMTQSRPVVDTSWLST